MKEQGMYFGTKEIYQLVKDNGGEWNDLKERPIVCLIKSIERDGLYWAIPVGNLDHRDKEGQERIGRFLSYPDNDLRHCYYHVGRTTVKSVFFISDVLPMTDKYIEREYLGYDNKHYIIKNQVLLGELEGKLRKILAFEASKPNYFRQHITDIKNLLIPELEQGEILETQEQVASASGHIKKRLSTY